MTVHDTLLLIPARMHSTRLPGKPLVDLAGLPMIVHVARQAIKSGLGRVVVATDHADIAKTVEKYGEEVVMTRDDHQSGSDRIWEAVQILDPDERVRHIVNVQGDLPLIEPDTIAAGLNALVEGQADIATLAAPILDRSEVDDPNNVKLIGTEIGNRLMRALYFTRAAAPWGDGPHFHHIGLYAYKREALARYVSLPVSPLEKRERLEQLRALEAGMTIDAAIVDNAPVGIDTQADLDMARALISKSGKGLG